MANATWNGSTSDDFNVAGNWTPSGVPTTGDNLFFVDASQNACLTNMDRTATAQINFPLVHIGPRYNRDLGTAADPLRAGIDELRMEGPNTAYIKANNVGSPNLPIDFINQKQGALFLDLLSATVQTTDLTLEGGQCTFEDGDCVNARLTGDALLTILAAVDVLTNLDIDRGQVVSSFAGHASINMGRSTLVLLAAAAVTTGAAKITNREGTIRYKSSGNITNIDLLRGAQLFTDGNDNDGPMTIALLRNFGGLCDLRNTSRNVVVTTLENHAGNSDWGIPPRTTVALADI